MALEWPVVIRAGILSILVGVVVTVVTGQVASSASDAALLAMVAANPLLTVGLGSALAVRRPTRTQRRSALLAPCTFLAVSVVVTLLGGNPGPGALLLVGGAVGAGLGWWSLTRRAGR